MIIGLTGGIASGKSTVSKYLFNKGIEIFDADKIAREISEKKEIIEELEKKLKVNLFTKENTLDRKFLKEIVFSDKNKLEILNSVIHPKVYNFFQNIKDNTPIEKTVIFDIPLLFESGMERLCDKTVVVVASENIQIQRIIDRDNIDKDLAKKIVLSQMSTEKKIEKADFTITNNGTLDDLIKEIEKFCKEINI